MVRFKMQHQCGVLGLTALSHKHSEADFKKVFATDVFPLETAKEIKSHILINRQLNYFGLSFLLVTCQACLSIKFYFQSGGGNNLCVGLSLSRHPLTSAH